MPSLNLSLEDGQSYPIQIECGLLKNCGTAISSLVPPCHVMLVSDENVAPLYLESAEESLKSAGFTVHKKIFPAGEPTKSRLCWGNCWRRWRMPVSHGQISRYLLAAVLLVT